jgi:adenine-specific DNA-methyltransferase
MTEKVRFGPANPHPLSQLKTELVWEGKYDEYGNRRVVDIAGCAMPASSVQVLFLPARSDRVTPATHRAGETPVSPLAWRYKTTAR